MKKNATTDIELFERVRKGDKTAFQTLFDRYYKLLLGTAINILRDVDSSKDAVQEVYIQIWKNREQINFTSSIENYLKRSVINRSLNQIKARQKNDSEPIEENHSTSNSVSDQIEADELEKIVEKTIETLPDRCRLIYILRRQEDLSLKEIAEKLNISSKTVENQLTKALKILKDSVKPYVEKYNDT
ncbi:MAG: RNA polymerase sigma-70 factor [Bacteroidales bacterium]|nr:RNA polymerase sigma-70 factor [Bacteroidales bacterium]